MPFAEPLIHAMKDPESPLNPQNLIKSFEDMHITPMDFATALVQQAGDGTTVHDMEIFEAQSDHVINAEADVYGTFDDEHGLHDVDPIPHDSTVLAAHDDIGAHDA